MSILKLSDEYQKWFIPENLKSTEILKLFDN